MSSLGEKSNQLHDLLARKLGQQVKDSKIEFGDLVIVIDPSEISTFFELLKLDSELSFDLLINITAIDWMDKSPERFEVVYHLMSLTHKYRLRVKIAIPESKPEIKSCVPLWGAANFFEREVWDMYGINFLGHPDLRRILMYDEFQGHPLRKDYPVQGKQPRIPLRAPEVENTARLMNRADLVQIRKPKAQSKGVAV